MYRMLSAGPCGAARGTTSPKGDSGTLVDQRLTDVHQVLDVGLVLWGDTRLNLQVDADHSGGPVTGPVSQPGRQLVRAPCLLAA